MDRTLLAVLAVAGTHLLLSAQALAEHAYVLTCCSVPSSVSVIDRATHKTAATLIAGVGAAATAFSSDGKTAYVANENDGTISVLDRSTGVLTATISLAPYGASPYGLIGSPQGMLYVTAGAAFNDDDAFIDVLGVDMATNTVEFDVQTSGTYLLDFSPIPAAPPALSSDGQHLYILAGQLIVFDTSTFQSQTVSLPSGDSHPQGIAVTADESYAFVTLTEEDHSARNAAGSYR